MFIHTSVLIIIIIIIIIIITLNLVGSICNRQNNTSKRLVKND
jgi:hypothetical protein